MRLPPPLRFLALVVGGWVVARATLLAPIWADEKPVDAPVMAEATAVSSPRILSVEPVRTSTSSSNNRPPRRHPRLDIVEGAVAAPLPVTSAHTPATTKQPVAALLPPPSANRWSGSAWLFLRDGGAAGLVPGGTLGGAQAGGRILYRLNGDAARPLALSGRLYAPLDNADAAEAAVGVDWKPFADIPLHLLAERRQALARDGRSAFALTVYGGISDRPAGPLRIEAYAQAGIVGVKSRDLFVDGSMRAGLPFGPVRIGGGVCGAAQPGVARVDVGPQASIRLDIMGRPVSLSADWRMRVFGDAAPSSGPTLTLGTDF